MSRRGGAKVDPLAVHRRSAEGLVGGLALMVGVVLWGRALGPCFGVVRLGLLGAATRGGDGWGRIVMGP